MNCRGVRHRSVLISGIGIAGPTLAYWLAENGFESTLVERAPQLRASGYVIDFWGVGYDIAERMGLIPDLRLEGYDLREVRFVDGQGRRIGGLRCGCIPGGHQWALREFKARRPGEVTLSENRRAM
jgi:2-polyprenyl-6-methoxyphenol hydroxylase-like FAD-dependent oxidoreductase